MVSGNKGQLVERILKHADGAVARTFDEDIEDDDETCSPVLMMIPQVILRRNQPSMKVVHQATFRWSTASKFYLLMMQTYQKECKGKEGCKEDRRLGRGGGGLKVISPLDGGGQEVILTLI